MQKIALEAAVLNGEIVDVAILKGRPLRNVEKQDSAQRLVDIDAEQFAEGRKARRRNFGESIELPERWPVEEPPANAIIQNGAERLRLALQEFFKIRVGFLNEVFRLEQKHAVARRDVAIETDDAVNQIHSGNGAHEYLAFDLDAEGVILKTFRQLLARAFEMPGEDVDEIGRLELIGFRHLGDGAADRIGLADQKTGGGRAEIMGLEHTETLALGDAHKGDDRGVLDYRVAVEHPGVLEVELAAGRTADEQAREFAVAIHRLHEETFAGRQAVDKCQRESVRNIDIEGRLNPRQFGADRVDALVKRKHRAGRADVPTMQRHRMHGNVSDKIA